jgi:hypothetical protein
VAESKYWRSKMTTNFEPDEKEMGKNEHNHHSITTDLCRYAQGSGFA